MLKAESMMNTRQSMVIVL